MGRRAQVDWIAIEGRYRANKETLREIAEDYGIVEGTIRKEAKKNGWVRDPEGTKRQLVKDALSGINQGITQAGTQYAMRIIEDEARQDVKDMQAGLDVARRCIERLREMLELTDGPRDVKVIAEANKIAIDTIRKVRGLDASDGKSLADLSEVELMKLAFG